MCQLSRCCCCFALRTGVYLATGYTMMLSAFGIVSMIWMLASGLNTVRAIALEKLEREKGYEYSEETIESAVDSVISLERITIVVTIVVYAIWALLACLMPVGLVKGTRGYLMPWIVMTYIMMVLGILGLIKDFRAIATEGLASNPYAWVSIGLLGLTVLANGMSVCGVNSYYKNNLKEERDIALVPNEAPPAYECSDYKNAV